MAAISRHSITVLQTETTEVDTHFLCGAKQNLKFPFTSTVTCIKATDAYTRDASCYGQAVIIAIFILGHSLRSMLSIGLHCYARCCIKIWQGVEIGFSLLTGVDVKANEMSPLIFTASFMVVRRYRKYSTQRGWEN